MGCWERGDSKYNYSFHELDSAATDVGGSSSDSNRGRRKRRQNLIISLYI